MNDDDFEFNDEIDEVTRSFTSIDIEQIEPVDNTSSYGMSSKEQLQIDKTDSLSFMKNITWEY